MLSGEYRHVLDSKNRIFIPAKFRMELGESFIVTRSFRGRFLCFYSMRAWEEYIAPLKSVPRKTSEDTLRYLYRNAAEATPDSQGRILLPKSLVDHAGIVKEAYIVGCGDYGEIWSVEGYEAQIAAEDSGKIREALEQLGL
ncbi:MAG: division/cell wall cluster transcriptional repressor MraZ [Clostridiales bacterium]|nr:division/cell wall cluster transcriptional repressor MraZ [Clostridiales bacterium]HOA85113.1 division/cell wall cluster transcriptional repressor MraZ [Bacillota bacterium]